MKLSFLKNKASSYKKLFLRSKEGEEVLADLLNFCGQYKCSYNSGDPYTSAYNEGKRRVALRILKFINMEEADMQKILKMTEAQKSEDTPDDPFGLYTNK
jgi:hypothetical protein